MTDPPDIRLPESVIATGDPLDSNPFRPGDPRHYVWNELTRDAEEVVCQIRAQIVERPKSFDELLNLPHPHDWLLNRRVAEFDAWAKRTVFLASTHDGVTAYKKWLLQYANAWLIEITQYLEENPPPFSVEDARREARSRFRGRVKYWIGVALQYRAPQEAHESGSGLVGAKATRSPDSPVPAQAEAVANAESAPSSEIGTFQVPPDDICPFDITAQDLGTREGRQEAVNAFLAYGNRTQPHTLRRHHIWKVMGYTTARQFQYWLEMKGPPKGSLACDQNARRVLAMSVSDFVDRLRRKGHL